MKIRPFAFIAIFFILLFITPSAHPSNPYFRIKEYTTEKVILTPLYIKGGVSQNMLTKSVQHIDYILGGYKTLKHGKWEPLDYVKINKRLISPRNAKTLSLLYAEKKEERIYLHITDNLASIPEENGSKPLWIVASGPVFEKATTIKETFAGLSKTHIRHRDVTARNALFLSNDGIHFALVKGNATILDVLEVFAKSKYDAVMFLDGGSSAYPYAPNPVWLIVRSNASKK